MYKGWNAFPANSGRSYLYFLGTAAASLRKRGSPTREERWSFNRPGVTPHEKDKNSFEQTGRNKTTLAQSLSKVKDKLRLGVRQLEELQMDRQEGKN